MKLIDDAELLCRVEQFLNRTGMAPTRFGREVMGEASLVSRLKDGRSLSLRNANKVISFIQEHENSTTPSPEAA